jgi:hypothetical protein
LNKEGELNSEAFHVLMKQQLKDHMLSQLVSSMVVADSVQHSMISTLKLILSQVTNPLHPTHHGSRHASHGPKA